MGRWLKDCKMAVVALLSKFIGKRRALENMRICSKFEKMEEHYAEQ